MRARVRPFLSITAVCFTALLALQSTGWLLAWQGLYVRAKAQAAQQVLQAPDRLREAHFQKDFFQQLKVGRKEIRYKGQLYDYQMISETKDSVQVSLYHDRHEQALLATLEQIFSPNQGNSSEAPPMMLLLAKWLGAAFIVPSKPVLLPPPGPLLQKQVFADCIFQAQSAPSVFAPPPEC